MKNHRLAVSVILALVGLLGWTARADVVVPVTGVTGHDGGNWPTTLGHLSDMVNGLDPTLIVTADTNPGMDTSAAPSDPSTWTYSGGSWHQEWKANSRLDSNATVNAKIGWAALDLGAVTTNLANLFLWNGRHPAVLHGPEPYQQFDRGAARRCSRGDL